MATTLIQRTIKRALVFGAYFLGVVGIIFVATIYESSKGVGENNLPGWILILVFFTFPAWIVAIVIIAFTIEYLSGTE